MTDATSSITHDLCTITEAARIARVSYRKASDLGSQGKFGEPVRISHKLHYAVSAVEAYTKQQAQEATA